MKHLLFYKTQLLGITPKKRLAKYLKFDELYRSLSLIFFYIKA
jgi:hypothetical protein